MHVIFSMRKRALIIFCLGWAHHIFDRWCDDVSPGSPPSASDDLDLFPCDISLDFPFRSTYRDHNVSGA